MNESTDHISNKSRSFPLSWLLGSVVFLIGFYTIWNGIKANHSQPLRLVVYAFSTQEEALTQGVFPAFEQFWEAETGQEVSIEGVFGPSGSLAGQINLGAPADIAVLSNQRHVDWLKVGKCIDQDTQPVMIASTPLVILTRPGNPAGLAEFADLAQPGLRLLHADPRSSGAGEWAVLAEYGSAYLETADHDTAETQLKDIWQNVRLVGSSARIVLALFELGAGDALVTYEQDALLAQERGVPLEIVIPEPTILARHFAVILDDNVTLTERPVVESFISFIISERGQQILSQYFFRPVTISNDMMPALANPFTEQALGGWSQAYSRIIENCWKNEIEPTLDMDPAATSLVRGE